jgi:hypothetical protein
MGRCGLLLTFLGCGTTAALATRAHWLTVEWLPKYAPELNDQADDPIASTRDETHEALPPRLPKMPRLAASRAK